MAWLTEAEFNHRMDVVSGRYRRRQPKTVTTITFDQVTAEFNREIQEVAKRVCKMVT